MKRNPAIPAAPLLPLLALLAALGLGACTPTSKVAEPDIVAKSPVAPRVLASCLAVKLGENFRDRRPTVDVYRGVHQITIDSPRGEKLAFVTVESDRAGGSRARFWNGDLYWPDHTVSGVWPDIMRDNWHRFENANSACQPTTAAKPAPKAPPPPVSAPAPAKPVLEARPLKPLAGGTPGAPRQLTP